MNTGDIRIKRWVLHDVPNSPKKGDGQPLGLSDDISPHSDKVASYLDRRLSSSLGKAAREVQEQASESELAVPKAVRKFFDSSHDALLEVSRDLAGYLHTCQSGNVSSGLLVVAQAEDAVAGEKMLVIMKLEPQDGVRATKTTRDDGSVVYDIGYVDDLMLTLNRRGFSAALI